MARDGGILEVAANVAPLYDERGLHIGEVCVFRDITVQKEAEETLFREKERAQVTLASIADGVITTDMQRQGRVLEPRGRAPDGVAFGAGARQSACVDLRRQ